MSNTQADRLAELPDAIRVPLHRIWADAGYLVGRAIDNPNSGRDLAVHTIKALCDEVERSARAALAKQQASPDSTNWRKEVGKMARALDQAQRHAEDSSHPATMREVSTRLNALLTTIPSAPQARTNHCSKCNTPMACQDNEYKFCSPSAPQAADVPDDDELLVGNLIAATLAEERTHEADGSDSEKDYAASRVIRAKDSLVRRLKLLRQLSANNCAEEGMKNFTEWAKWRGVDAHTTKYGEYAEVWSAAIAQGTTPAAGAGEQAAGAELYSAAMGAAAIEASATKEIMRSFWANPRPGVPAAELNDRERVALAVHAGAPYEVEMQGSTMTVRTTVPVGITDRDGGGYNVAIGQPSARPT